MGRDLIDTVRTYFSRKSSAQLREILETDDRERWSPEAIAAASEVLRERTAGRALEPDLAEEEAGSPRYHYEPGEVALGVLAGLLTGHLIVPYYERVERSERPDLPVPFGRNLAWLALETTDTGAVATALGLRDTREATWEEGVGAAYRSSVFVTPPLADWTLAAGTALFLPDRIVAFVKPLLQRLSGEFGEAQYFCSYGDIDLDIWARATRGTVVRGYGWLGEMRLTLWDEGDRTEEEIDLGFTFSEGSSKKHEAAANEKEVVPDEGRVMQIASLWSIDPTTLDGEFGGSGTGLLGTAAWGSNTEPNAAARRPGE